MPGAGSASPHGTVDGRARRVVRRPRREPGERPREHVRGRPRARRRRARERRQPARIGNGASTASSTRARRGRPSSTSPTTFTKQSTASAAVAASAPSASAPASPSATPPFAGTASSDWSVEPLGGEPVQRREPGDRHRADEERASRPGHPLQESAEAIDLERARGPLESARSEEQETLEDGVVERVQERGRDARRPPSRLRRVARRRRQAPSPSTMIPTFSIEWNASSRLSSCWKIA